MERATAKTARKELRPAHVWQAECKAFLETLPASCQSGSIISLGNRFAKRFCFNNGWNTIGTLLRVVFPVFRSHSASRPGSPKLYLYDHIQQYPEHSAQCTSHGTVVRRTAALGLRQVQNSQRPLQHSMRGLSCCKPLAATYMSCASGCEKWPGFSTHQTSIVFSARANLLQRSLLIVVVVFQSQSQSGSLAVSQSRSLAVSQSRSLAVSQSRSLAVSQSRSLAVSQSQSQSPCNGTQCNAMILQWNNAMQECNARMQCSNAMQ